MAEESGEIGAEVDAKYKVLCKLGAIEDHGVACLSCRLALRSAIEIIELRWQPKRTEPIETPCDPPANHKLAKDILNALREIVALRSRVNRMEEMLRWGDE